MEKLVKDKNTNNNHKNPYAHNGESLVLPTHLTTQNQEGLDTQVTDNQQDIKKTHHGKRVYKYTYGCPLVS